MTAPIPRPSSSPPSAVLPDAAAHFARTYRAEHATTRRVLEAFPPDRWDFQPHPRASTAHRLAWTFVLEEGGMLAALEGRFALPSGGFPPPPDDWTAVLAAFAAQHQQLVDAAASVTTDRLLTPVRFFTGPREVGDVLTHDLLWFFLRDQIHHRGQLAVYLRLVDGRVPSIYGPTADEPWQ